MLNHGAQPIPAVPGIYRITCLDNGRIYVGSAVNLSGRWNKHRYELRHNIHGNPKLQNAWNKYTESSFFFEVLELVLIPEMLTAREQFWFQKLHPFGRKGFNIARQAGSNLGNKGRIGQKSTPEAIEKMRQAKLGNTYNRGRKHTPESIEKMRQATLGKKRTPEACERMRQTHIGHKRSPESIEKQRQTSAGRKHTPEAIEKMRQTKLGNTYSLGRKHTPEAIEKMRQAKLNQSSETRKKISNAMQGRKPSPQTIEAVKQANQRRKLEKEKLNGA